MNFSEYYIFEPLAIDSSVLYRPLIMALVWAVIFSSDWFLNFWGIKLYHRHVSKFWSFEKGYSLRSMTIDETHPRHFLPRYLSELVITTTGLWIVLYGCKLYLSSWKLYEFFCGAFILLEAMIHFRHLRIVGMFSLTREAGGISGSISIPRWVSLRNAFIEFTTFALAMLIIFLFDNKNFFTLGGVCSCAIAALYYLILAEREKKEYYH